MTQPAECIERQAGQTPRSGAGAGDPPSNEIGPCKNHPANKMTAVYTEPLICKGAGAYIRNVRTKVELVRAGEQLLPVTVNDTEYDNSYVCSPYSTYVSYALEELVLFKSELLKGALRGVIGILSPLLKSARINRNVHVNNWLLSTNLYEELPKEDVRVLTAGLLERFPSHAVIFRSLNEVTNFQLMKDLTELGWILVPSRQVYFFEGREPDYMLKPNNVWDQKLLRRSPLRIVEHEEIEPSDYPRIVELYEDLYIRKYSRLNPRFTEAYIANCHLHGLLRIRGLRDSSGMLQGVIGCFDKAGVITAPLVGYNTALPQKEGLYRMLMSLVLTRAADEGKLLHLSSGAAHFKRIRGGRPAIEYSAVYIRHLPLRRRAVWLGLSHLLNGVGVPVMRKYRL
ncbi:GNAT family N-acetyltransferase [Paenibacillus chitinolyticus]|uniref:GNAT family N-acetyltransferase n=1 Tax=Paenibacillus chitinolyticus TaxID=79263 RepID=UPI0036DB2A64